MWYDVLLCELYDFHAGFAFHGSTGFSKVEVSVQFAAVRAYSIIEFVHNLAPFSDHSLVGDL